MSTWQTAVRRDWEGSTLYTRVLRAVVKVERVRDLRSAALFAPIILFFCIITYKGRPANKIGIEVNAKTNRTICTTSWPENIQSLHSGGTSLLFSSSILINVIKIEGAQAELSIITLDVHAITGSVLRSPALDYPKKDNLNKLYELQPHDILKHHDLLLCNCLKPKNLLFKEFLVQKDAQSTSIRINGKIKLIDGDKDKVIEDSGKEQDDTSTVLSEECKRKSAKTGAEKRRRKIFNSIKKGQQVNNNILFYNNVSLLHLN
uniref:Uncharacterized protein n=1 Tax=Glossina austeni TaxID=7395 RepID=A0A1A9UF94_GLOAU